MICLISNKQQLKRKEAVQHYVENVVYNYNCSTCMCETNDVFKMEDTGPSYGTCKLIIAI